MMSPPQAPADRLRPPAILIRKASVSYEGRALFKDLDMDLTPGCTTCILGKSGIGKSTLLRLVAGLERGEGETWIGDSEGADLEGRIAYMAQSDLLLPWLGVLDNVLLGDRLRGEEPRREEALELLSRVGLAGRERDLPAALSGGMRQRVALARTLMERRPVVLMDEPFSALDAITRLKLQDLAAGLLRGRTVLLVTHDPLEALRLGDEIRVVHGQPARIDPPMRPAGAPPRPVSADHVARLTPELLQRLEAVA